MSRATYWSGRARTGDSEAMSCLAPGHLSQCASGDCAWCRQSLAPSPPAAPELPEGWVTVARNQARREIAGDVCMPLVALKEILATQGLTIVDAKDRALLEEVKRNAR